jgi:hypothetical protein
MKTDSYDQTKQDTVAVRGACGALGFLFGAISIAQIWGSPSSMDGWSGLASALVFCSYAFTYKRSGDVVFRTSKQRVGGVLAICAIPPIVLLCLLGDRPGWLHPLVAYMLLSLSLGPILLLRRFAVWPKSKVQSLTSNPS